MTTYTPAVDLHSHFLPPSYMELLSKYNVTRPDDYPVPYWSEEQQLESMDEMGVEYAVLTSASPDISLASPGDTVEYARRVNCEGDELVRKHPDRLALAGTLPLPNVEKSIEEVRFCVKELGVKAFGVHSHARGIYLGCPELDPVLAEINKYGLPVIMHPTTPAAVPENVCRRLPIPVIEFFFESTRVMTNLILNRTLRKFPNIKFVIPHAGACMPLITERVQGVVDLPETPYPDVDVLGDLKRLYFDVTGVAEDKRLKALLEIADESHIVYGSDNPHAPIHVRHRTRAYLRDTGLISEETRNKIFYENARAFI